MREKLLLEMKRELKKMQASSPILIRLLLPTFGQACHMHCRWWLL